MVLSLSSESVKGVNHPVLDVLRQHLRGLDGVFVRKGSCFRGFAALLFLIPLM